MNLHELVGQICQDAMTKMLADSPGKTLQQARDHVPNYVWAWMRERPYVGREVVRLCRRNLRAKGRARK